MDSYEEVVSGLLQALHRIHPERLAPLLADHIARLGLGDPAIYVVDIEQRLLIPLPGAGVAEREPLGVDVTLPGRAFRTETILQGAEDDDTQPGVRLWVPMLDGAERVGVLGVTVDEADEVALRRAHDLASIAATAIIAKQAYGDQLVLTRRNREMDVAAEMRWELLPPLTYVNESVQISGILEPAYEIAGDTFDYSINGDVAHLAILDAMGHGLEASRMANLAVLTYRNARRQGGGPEELFTLIDEVVSSVFGDDRFVTGQLATLDTTTGQLRWINAGHPQPVLLRDGTTHAPETETCLPFGLGDIPVFSADMHLEPGDTVLFFTDGVPEARSPDGEPFSRDRLTDLLVRAASGDEPLAETARKLCHAVLEHQQGRLQDDATLMLVRWTGPTTPH